MAGNSINIPAYGAASWKAPVASAAALPASGNSDGDVRALLDSELLYIWNGSAWVLLVAPGATPPGGSTTQVQYNNAGAFAGSSGLTYNSGTNVLTVSGGVTANLTGNVTGTASGNTTISGQTNHGVVVSGSANAMTSTGAGTSGQFLGSNGASADPTFKSLAASDIASGTLPIARGGTNSSTALNNNRVMQSSGDAIVEAAAITAARALISDANGIPTHSSVTSTELGYVSGVTSAIQTQLNARPVGSLSKVVLTEDFIAGAAQGSTNWTPTANGGAVAQHNGATFAQLNPGVIELRTSTSSSAAPSLNLGINIFQAGGGAMSVEGVARLDALSDGTDTYTVRLGFGDSTTGTAPTDGMWLEYTHSVNSGNWTFNTASSGTTATSNGSIAAVAGAWFRFKITCNAAGTSASGYINDVLVNTNTTFIPSGAGRSFGIQFSMTKSAGNTQRILYIDWAQIIQDLTSSR